MTSSAGRVAAGRCLLVLRRPSMWVRHSGYTMMLALPDSEVLQNVELFDVVDRILGEGLFEAGELAAA